MTKRRRFTPEFKAQVVLEVLTGARTTAVGEAWQDVYAEHLIRSIKCEEVNLSDYRDYIDAYGQSGRFPDELCTPKGVHCSLGY